MEFPPHHGSIASLTPTVCHLLGVKPPQISAEPPLDIIIAALAKDKFPLQKCLIVAPDAIGAHLWRAHESELRQVLPLAPLRVPLRAVFPSKTPVCFASMFTGAQPEMHGIQSYSRPVLGCDTFFDALIRAGKKIAIVAVENSSVDLPSELCKSFVTIIMTSSSHTNKIMMITFMPACHYPRLVYRRLGSTFRTSSKWLLRPIGAGKISVMSSYLPLTMVPT
jgi:hypothetical protein